MIEKLTQYIKSVLEANALIQAVYPYERANSDGTPFATITVSGNENDYKSTTENSRTYSFLIRLFVERGGQTEPEDCEATMRELVDTVLDDLLS